MSVLVLFALIAAGFTIQYQLDRRSLRELARQRGWSELELRWTPWAPATLLRSRTERSYWLRYCDASGRIERRLAHVGNPFHGAFGVELTPVADEAGPGRARVGPTDSSRSSSGASPAPGSAGSSASAARCSSSRRRTSHRPTASS